MRVQTVQSSLGSTGLLLCFANETGLGPVGREGIAQAKPLRLAL